MNLNTVLRHLVAKKFNVVESHIVRTDDTFTITSNDGQIFTEANFTQAEIAETKLQLEANQQAAEAEAEAKKQALLDRLGITEEEAKLLLAQSLKIL